MSPVLIIAAIVATVAFVFAITVIRAWKEWHHFHLGALLFALAWWQGWTWLAVIAVLVMIDDSAQHVRQITHPKHRSLLHKLYARTLYRWLS